MAELDDVRIDEFVAQLDGIGAPDAELELRSADRREISMRIVPWEVPAISRAGPEVIMRGAFDGVDPSKVVLQLEHENPPAGKGIEYENRSDGAYMVFKVSKTQRGDDILTLAADGVSAGASVTYQDIKGGTEMYQRSGVRLRVVHRAALRAVSTTWQPTWADAGVQSIRSAPTEAPVVGEQTMPETPVPETPETPAPFIFDTAPLAAAMDALSERFGKSVETLTGRLDAMEERSRKEIDIPAKAKADDPRTLRGDWVQAVIQMLSGDRVNALQMRALDDIITSDNVGVVPDAYLPELVGVIDPTRPFLGSTRKLDLPAAGMSLVVPVIETRPTTGVQVNGSGTPTEKADIVSTATSITTDSFDAVTIAGGGDLSIQILKRSSPSFLSLYLELLAEAYAANAEAEAIGALLTSGITAGGTVDPEALALGDAWAAGAAVRKPPTTMWLSSAGVSAFIDAKADGTNMPLYSSIQAGFSASAGTGGVISGLRPIHVPALDATDTDMIVGPSSGFGWTEDGTYTLQVDVPAKAGRDVALVGILWFAPLYPSAFTGYTLGS